MKLALKLFLAVVVIGGFICIYPPARLSLLVLAGRTKGCPYAEALRSAENMSDQMDRHSRIANASRMLKKDGPYHLWQTPHGQFWLPSGSDYALPWDLAEQERRIYGTGPRAVQKGDVVLDCGANIGVFVRVALRAGASKVIAIELAPENIECLRRNFENELRDGRVVIYPKGVWDKDDFLTLNVDPQNSAADSVVMRPDSSHQGPRVPLTTIDQLVSELKLDRVDFIKMDIEGAETNALAGAKATLAKFHPRMSLSAYHKPEDPERIPELARKGWSGYHVECGPCADAKTFVRPDVLYFY